MAGYVLINTQAGSLQAMTTTYKSLTRAVAAPTAKRVRYVEMEFSAVSVPNSTDCQVQADLTYCSAAGAGTLTAATPQPLDSAVAIGTPSDIAVTTGGVNYTAEPTTFAQANCWFNRGFNQRSGVLWQTQPGREIIMPSTTITGGVLRALSTNYTGNVVAKLIFDEL